jgi:DNA replicative helicase MCM subunit Mcm2 (Cdc46/Mcm family)
MSDAENWISAASLALHHLLNKNKKVMARFFNFTGTTAIRSIRSNEIGNFLSVQGVVL